MLCHVTGWVRLYYSFDDRMFCTGELRVVVLADIERPLCFGGAKKLEQLRKVVLFKRRFHLGNLGESVRFDFEFDRGPRRVLNQRVTRLELEISRNISDPKDDETTVQVRVAVPPK